MKLKLISSLAIIVLLSTVANIASGETVKFKENDYHYIITIRGDNLDLRYYQDQETSSATGYCHSGNGGRSQLRKKQLPGFYQILSSAPKEVPQKAFAKYICPSSTSK